MKNFHKKIIYGIFVLLFLFYAGYNYIDFTATNYEILNIGIKIKYCSILACLILALLNSGLAKNKKDSIIVSIALAFTLLSDTFLLLFQKNAIGVACFCFVHLSYIYRYKPNWIAKVAVFATLLVCFLLLAKILTKSQYLSFENIFAIVYLFLFALDFINFSKADKTNIIAPFVWIGLTLFFFCDFNVALFNILSNETFLFKFASKAMWIFYLPSQVLLALSSKRKVKLF